ncbi:NADH-quinone oxidoreductase subunit J [Streptomyces sp. MST-110588]|uniref:NADH-quinone oxidoreductase subunit J n=1 Tax=Streptomyces sp. MST-110588 TaxID=2833628 RepID=UPI001F5C0C18|nr:NADH-quinone oxidoreductase subunit J [Streptomyces sp. MST-110588]UNO44034.1 NADH-quinone oxidoreductase subunit J [Streptomyces sp. MST-110588]
MTVSLAAASATSSGEAVQFWILGTVAVIGALCTILLKRAVHSALSLAGTMIVLAVFYLANGAYFLGVVQIVVYTGAIMMLFLFVVMLVGVTAADSLKETLKGQRWLAALCGLGFGILLVAGLGNASLKHFDGLGEANAGGNVQGLAALIFTKYVFAFEVTGALLITAAVGAMVLTHRERTERAGTQRERSQERVRSGVQAASLPGGAAGEPKAAGKGGSAWPLPTPAPAPGVYARHNAVDIPGLLPDGTPSDLTVNATLRQRGQIRDVSGEALADLAALEQRSEEWLGRTADPDASEASRASSVAEGTRGTKANRENKENKEHKESKEMKGAARK